MKKIISMLLVFSIVLSMGITSALATEVSGNWSDGTVVTYNADATATEYYTVTVPATLDPGDSGTVTAEGKFPSNMTLTVTADTSVSLSDGISTKTLGVSFAGIELTGSNTAAVSASNSVAVTNWNDEVKAPLFGEWKGTFNYLAEFASPYEKTFANNSWDEIAEACANNEVPSTWAVGNTKTTTVNGTQYNVTIIGKNHDTYSDGSGTAPLTLQMDIISTSVINSVYSNKGGWPGSAAYTYLNTEIINTLEFADHIKAVAKSTNEGYYASDKSIATISNDKLFLLSIVEVLGTQTTEVFNLEGSQYEYYAEATANAVKKYNGTKTKWWLRTPAQDRIESWKCISTGGSTNNGYTCDSNGISFAFCFGGPCNHADTNGDFICEFCGAEVCSHTDADSNNLCDSCGEVIDEALTLENYSWAEIAAACQNGEVPAAWHVGDTKTMTINGVEYDVAIIGKNYDTYADGSGVAPLTFMLIEPTGKAAMNSTDTTDGGWPASEMRSMLNETIINTLEDDVKNNIKAVKKTTVAGAEDQTGDSLVYDESEDKLFLLSTAEFESSSTRYEYFNETHFNTNNPLYNWSWWLRSPWSNYEGYFKCHSTGYSYSGNSPSTLQTNYIFGFCF